MLSVTPSFPPPSPMLALHCFSLGDGQSLPLPPTPSPSHPLPFCFPPSSLLTLLSLPQSSEGPGLSGELESPGAPFLELSPISSLCRDNGLDDLSGEG